MSSNKYPTARPFLPESRSITALAGASQRCEGCPLFQGTTQTVFGEGPKNARLVLVGEQPGDQEDRTGRPFVGPAGAHLDEALEEAGLDRREIYVTNAVKHFKHEVSGSRRIGKTPLVSEINACRPWLESELQTLQPELIVALGAVAARSLFNESVTIAEVRGKFFQNDQGLNLIVTFHPSAALRHPVDDERKRIAAALIEDLKRARHFLEDLSRPDLHPH